MKYWLVGFLILFTLNATNSTAQTVKFTLDGHTVYKSGKARLMVYYNKSQFIPFDSAEIKDGNFYMSDTLDEPKLFSLQYAGENRTLFIGNEHIVITQEDSVTKQMTVTGSPLTNDYDNYTARWLTPLVNRLRNVNQTITTLDVNHQQEKDSLNKIQSSLFSRVPDSTVAFIREHPASFVSLYFLNYYGDSYNVILMNSLYKLLHTELKQYPSAEFIKQKIALGLHESARCPQFSVPDSNNQPVTLQSFKGSYVFIDFWASWCAPCLQNIPYVQQAAVQYQYQNFTVLTASLDNNMNAWKSAVQKYHLADVCRNVVLKNTFRNPMALQFNISYIPCNVLVDPEGNIISRNIDGPQLQQKLSELLGNTKKQ